jgi:archaemetzincin
LTGILVPVFFAVALLDSPGAPARKCLIAVAPVGDVSVERIEALLPTLRETFGCEIEIAPAVPLPSFGWNAERRQQLSTAILDALARAKPPEWERLLGVAGVDLYVPQLNFVFGEGDSRRGVAVFSLARLHGPDDVFRKRAATEAVHELGHTHALSHCDDPHCVMWFSNTLAETDRKGTRFCFRHAKELARSRPAPPRATR